MPVMESMSLLGSCLAFVMFVWTIFRQWFPEDFRSHVEKYGRKLASYVYPYIEITFHEYQGDEFERSKAYVAIERYLSERSSTEAKRLKANVVKDCESVVLSMDDYEEVSDDFNGIKLWWTSNKRIPQTRALINWHHDDDEKRYYKLVCHRRDRDIITRDYVNHVLGEGRAIAVRTRQRKLYTNNKSENWSSWRTSKWSHVVFEHPSTFDTMAMEAEKKRDIMNDLIKFSRAKDYYKKIGKSWKRGYLLYGPPGTGKSSMIAAMANLLEYDIYDLELTSVKDNTDLRKLLIDTSSKSIIVIEDIDCSLDLTGQREAKKEKNDDDKTGEDKDPVRKMMEERKEKKGSEVTLSGLLNFIDGLWSACGSERLIVFTTNYVEKLDPALIRRGRMDKHIELSYCCYEAFLVLAKNYLDLEWHELFATIRQLLEETKVTPADVAENLMPKSDEENAETCMMKLIEALEKAKEEERVKAEEEAKEKAEEEEKKKKETKEKAAEKEEKKEAKQEETTKEQHANGTKENGAMA